LRLLLSHRSSLTDAAGYWQTPLGGELRDITFEPAELAVLGVAARTWQQASLGSAASGALLKLRAAGVDIDDAVPVAIETRVATSEPAFEAVRQATADRRAITFEYRTPGVKRHVEPWGLVSWHGRWYLVGHDRDRREPRVFRVSRMVGAVRALGRRGDVKVPDGVDVRKIVLQMVEEPVRTSATVLVRKGAAQGMRRRATSVTPHGDGWDLLELPIAHAERLADEAIGFGPDVVIVEPAEARAAVLARLRALASAAAERTDS
jgi:predicted DNA-binding transcriptional regulator YafY